MLPHTANTGKKSRVRRTVNGFLAANGADFLHCRPRRPDSPWLGVFRRPLVSNWN